jgi:hypothetical protein
MYTLALLQAARTGSQFQRSMSLAEKRQFAASVETTNRFPRLHAAQKQERERPQQVASADDFGAKYPVYAEPLCRLWCIPSQVPSFQ